jgi:hypothetical protein
MSVFEAASALPAHLYYAYLHKPVTRTVHRILQKSRFLRRGVPARPSSLNARIVARWIQRRRGNAWLILCFHNVAMERTASPYSINLNDFRVKAIATGPQRVVTVGA